MSKNEDKAAFAVGCAVLTLWGLGVLASLAFMGAVVWGIVELVSWLVTK